MHAGFPNYSQHLHSVLTLGRNHEKIPQIVEKLGGPIVAKGVAALVEFGFVFVMRDALLDPAHRNRATRFFDDNFVIRDPYVKGGQRYYNGKFLLRTKKPGDNMNVHIEFCKNPDALFCDTPFGKTINPLEIVTTTTLTENQALAIERNPDKVDLVIAFKDLASIINLIGRDEVDVVGLLLENMVQLTGNVGHLFKLGAIACEVERFIGVANQPTH
ncbi:MAG: hypothetical protein OEW58_04225 [Gammaproteobacteria bacterium]|nr:hypothetical protein [Gammaproteobacteria bacterium]